MKKIILLIALIIGLSSCKETKTIPKVAVNEIPSGKYEIKSIQGELINNLYFVIDASENKISGKTNCNTYGVHFSINNNEVKIGSLTATKMYCEENVMIEENNLFKAFKKTSTFVFDNNMLIFSSENEVVLQAYKMK